MPSVPIVASALASAGSFAAADGPSLAPYLSGGGTVAAVTALVYVVRKLTMGELVPRNVEEHARELNAAIIAAGQRERDLMRALEGSTKALESSTAEIRSMYRRKHEA